MLFNAEKFHRDPPKTCLGRAEGAEVWRQRKPRRSLVMHVRFEPSRVERECWIDAYERVEPVIRRILRSESSEEGKYSCEPRMIRGGGTCDPR